MRASQKKNAVPMSASQTATFAQVLPVIEPPLREGKQRQDPALALVVGAHDDGEVLEGDGDGEAQKISDSTPSTAWRSKVPAASSASCMAYSGLVPISP